MCCKVSENTNILRNAPDLNPQKQHISKIFVENNVSDLCFSIYNASLTKYSVLNVLIQLRKKSPKFYIR